jgi:hypothetical protein
VSGVLLALVMVAPPASAARPLINEHYDDSFGDSFDDCGFVIEVDNHFWGHFMVWEVPGSDGEAYYGHDNYNYRNVFTNPETGAWFLGRGHALFREFDARHISGDIWSFKSNETGQPFVIEDSDGNVVIRDRGRINRTTTYDLLGDGQPGGEFISEEVHAR